MGTSRGYELFKKGAAILTYDSYSTDLSQIADRRRTAIWKDQIKDIEQSGQGEEIHIHVANPFSTKKRLQSLNKNTRLVLDLVDGYLAEQPSLLKDYLRQLSRVGVLEFLRRPIRFSKSLTLLCEESDLIIVASQEQAEVVRNLNPNVIPIWDCHDELGEPRHPSPLHKESKFEIFWEGLSVTLFHFQECLPDLKEFLLETNSTLNIVSNPNHFRFSNRFLKVSTEKYLGKIFRELEYHIKFHEWSVTRVREVASRCDFGLIPLLERDKFARLKPENKLMIYWRLGLPTLFSGSPSYLRVAQKLGLSDFSVEGGRWKERLLWLSKDLVNQGGRISTATDMLVEHHNEQAILAQWRRAFQSLTGFDPTEASRSS